MTPVMKIAIRTSTIVKPLCLRALCEIMFGILAPAPHGRNGNALGRLPEYVCPGDRKVDPLEAVLVRVSHAVCVYIYVCHRISPVEGPVPDGLGGVSRSEGKNRR